MRKQRYLIPAALAALVVAATACGCGKNDPTLTSAPPASSDARSLGNAAGKKPTAGAMSIGSGSGSPQAGGGANK